MDFFLVDPGGVRLQLPVNPQEVTIRREKNYDTVRLLNFGEIDWVHGQKIREIAFSSFFPGRFDPGYCRYQELPDPQYAMNQLTLWTIGKTPVRLIITGTAVNVLVLVSAHHTTLKGGEPDDLYFELQCRTWRQFKISSHSASSGSASPRPDTRPIPTSYTVKKGDTLWSIAKLQFGSGGRWRDIYQINKKTIGPSPDLIVPGQKLVMPS